jgi:hypothetical protein
VFLQKERGVHAEERERYSLNKQPVCWGSGAKASLSFSLSLSLSLSEDSGSYGSRY